jgi:hypothetical protein
MIVRGLLAVLLMAGVAHADARTGVVVTGDAKLQAPLAATLEGWLRTHNHEPFASPLDADAINTIVDCMVIEDQSCARTIIDKRAKSDAVVFARIDSSPAKKAGQNITITAYWFVRGHDATAERRVCEHCTSDGMRTTAESIMKALSAVAETQKPSAESEPVESPPAPAPAPTAPAPPPTPQVLVVQRPPSEAPDPDRTLPIAIGAAGVVALGTSIGLMMHADDGSAPTYRDTKPAGVVVGIAALGLIGFDVYLWLRPSHPERGPIAIATRDAAIIGWGGRF